MVCSKSELEDELLRFGIVPPQPPLSLCSPPKDDVEADTPALATKDNVPGDAMSGIDTRELN